MVLEKTLENPLTARRSNQSILNKINTEYLLEGLMLKLQYFGHLVWRADSLEKILLLGKMEGSMKRGNRGWDSCMASSTQRTWVWANTGRWWRRGKPRVLQSMELQRVRHSDWITATVHLSLSHIYIHIYSLYLYMHVCICCPKTKQLNINYNKII